MSGARDNDKEWEREALRLCARYIDEVVLAFGLCPWAEPALRGGRVGRAVCLAEAPRVEDCLPFIDGFATGHQHGHGPEVDIGLLLFPRAGTHLGWGAFDAFAERVRRAHRAQPVAAAIGGATFLIAAFHSDGADRAHNPHQAVSFFRRTPDPMLQFVRAEVIDRVKAGQSEASNQVAEHNFRRLADGGDARLSAVVRELQADREATYARLRNATP